MSIFNKKNNVFNFIKIMAAIVVIYSHSYFIAPEDKYTDLVAKVTGVTTAGEISVAIFFFLSGALVTKSLFSSDNAIDYLKKRIFRVYPALIICCFLTAYVFSWVFGGASLIGIITSEGTFNYFLSNSVAVWNIHVIPGVYATHRTNALNGSLWSITLEARLYLFLAVLYVSGFFVKSREYIVAVFAVLVISIAVYPSYVPMIGNDYLSYGNYSFPVFSCIFLLGGIFYLLEDKVRIGLPIVIVFLVMVLLFKGSLFYKGSILSFAIVFSIWLGTCEFAKKRLQLKNDYSYGMYLYGWPAQQIAYSILNDMVQIKPWMITVVAIPIAFMFAFLSWKLIEKPCIKISSKKSNLFFWIMK